MNTQVIQVMEEGVRLKLVGGVGKLVVIGLNIDADCRVTFDANADLTWEDENILGWEHSHVDERYVAELAAFNEAYYRRDQAEWDEERRLSRRRREARKRRERRAQRRQVEAAAREVIQRQMKMAA